MNQNEKAVEAIKHHLWTYRTGGLSRDTFLGFMEKEIALLEASPPVPVSGKEQEACEWVHVIPDGIGSWYESSCGLIGDGPNQSWKHCPECGKKINLTVEEVES